MAHWLVGALLAVAIGRSLAARPLDGVEGGHKYVVADPPKWPDSYEIEYTVTLPYIQTLQPGGLKYPVHVWWDGPGQRFRFEVYNGLDAHGWDVNEGLNWNLYARIKETVCDFTNNTAGPTLMAGAEVAGAAGAEAAGRHGGPSVIPDGPSLTPLPDLTSWAYSGSTQINNAAATAWQWVERHGDKTASYTFYTSNSGVPLRFDMMGINLIQGSHFDEYTIEFTRFKPGPLPASAFKLPPQCETALQQQQQEGAGGQGGQRQALLPGAGLAARLSTLLPSAGLVGAHLPSTSAALSAATSAFQQNSRLVDEHNRLLKAAAAPSTSTTTSQSTTPAPTPSYTLALNHFAHLTEEQWAAAMLGRRKRTDPSTSPTSSSASTISTITSETLSSSQVGQNLSSQQQQPHRATPIYQRVLTDDQLPASVDWRGTGADGAVKDQASCGSCWAFAATGAMQGAWFKATGQSLSFSEQQLLDCSWDFGNTGCFGGEVDPTIDYVVRGGGVASEAAYPYLGQNGFCRGPIVPPPPHTSSTTTSSSNSSSTTTTSSSGPTQAEATVPLVARFSGYQSVPSRDEGALMEALALHGPLSVGMSVPGSFRFYSDGVYASDKCKTALDDLEHAIVLVGYGTTPEGVDYWIIKNSWSKYWGMDGYARIARKGNDCGISTDPVLVTVDAQAAAEAAVAEAAVAAARQGAAAAA